ncbi:AMP-binding protein [Flavobacterium branchiophilum]|uniref:O-succinylbenzoic acid--CoA ligase n=1 Tax=Flavobacterium branchiophilum TaxID=55197 RepID=A0A2H3KC40_9FLAO|nr:AMP-binding protein [Flavobacterium branchiophilum]PDS24799.1 O-succinylbenzoic acid--CoA ligase [Flavobacterium branchiophilum]
MSTISYQKVHNQFKMNGFHFDRDSMLRVAYCLIKEGADYEKPVGNFFLDWFDEKSYLEIPTSGSTGPSKTVRIEKQAMVNSALATGDFFGLKPGDRALHCLPVKYIAGKMMFVRAFILGLDIDFVAPSAHPLENNTTKYDFAAMVPMQAQNSLDALKNIKKLIVGGAKVSEKLEYELSKLPYQVYITFGMTETITHIAAKKVGEKWFTTLPNVKIGIDDRQCLTIDASKISDEKIITNDIVEIQNDNQFHFIGRLDNVVNSGGIKLIPEQIEKKLDPYFNKRFFVAGLADENLGEKLVLVIEGLFFEIDPTIFDVLDKYEKPKDIIFKEKFNETLTGKVIRNDFF